MNRMNEGTRQVACIVQKDIRCELRSFQTMVRMLGLGIIVAFLMSYQTDLPSEQLQRIAARSCWITICVASVFNVGHSIMSEQEDRCWEALRSYPTSPETLYVAKLMTSTIALGVLQIVLIPFFAIASDATWLAHPGKMLLIGAVANLGISSMGTLFAASAVQDKKNHFIYMLIVLPLLLPVMLSASEATRLVTDPHAADTWWNWMRLLGTCGVTYATLGWLLFAYLIED